MSESLKQAYLDMHNVSPIESDDRVRLTRAWDTGEFGVAFGSGKILKDLVNHEGVVKAKHDSGYSVLFDEDETQTNWNVPFYCLELIAKGEKDEDAPAASGPDMIGNYTIEYFDNGSIRVADEVDLDFEVLDALQTISNALRGDGEIAIGRWEHSLDPEGVLQVGCQVVTPDALDAIVDHARARREAHKQQG